mmetsp:Transcript_17618/g.48849  ORF Transcript_17618/g.48849 Transcript_17618/m.48849 type:complete len:233 (-) Transcript_17618:1433-2131(-)
MVAHNYSFVQLCCMFLCYLFLVEVTSYNTVEQLKLVAVVPNCEGSETHAFSLLHFAICLDAIQTRSCHNSSLDSTNPDCAKVAAMFYNFYRILGGHTALVKQVETQLDAVVVTPEWIKEEAKGKSLPQELAESMRIVVDKAEVILVFPSSGHFRPKWSCVPTTQLQLVPPALTAADARHPTSHPTTTPRYPSALCTTTSPRRNSPPPSAAGSAASSVLKPSARRMGLLSSVL